MNINNSCLSTIIRFQDPFVEDNIVKIQYVISFQCTIESRKLEWSTVGRVQLFAPLVAYLSGTTEDTCRLSDVVTGCRKLRPILLKHLATDVIPYMHLTDADDLPTSTEHHIDVMITGICDEVAVTRHPYQNAPDTFKLESRTLDNFELNITNYTRLQAIKRVGNSMIDKCYRNEGMVRLAELSTYLLTSQDQRDNDSMYWRAAKVLNKLKKWGFDYGF